MSSPDFSKLVKKGISAADQGNTLDALSHFEAAGRMESSPILSSYLGYCVARERLEFKEGMDLCRQALALEPGQAVHYLNLGRVFLVAGRKGPAIVAFRQGLRQERHRLILDELNKLGRRQPPALPFLSRSHLVNKFLGQVLTHLHLR